MEIEIYDVDDQTLAACDRLEGHPNWYRRKQITTKGGITTDIYSMDNLPDGEFEKSWEVSPGIYSFGHHKW